MFKPTYLLLATAAAASMLAVPLSSEEIVVSTRSHAAFVDDVSSDLDTQLRRMRYDPRFRAAGIVKLRFRAGEDGKPVDMTTYESSGSRRLDSEIAQAVARIDTLLPLPVSAGADPVIQANVVVARSKSDLARLTRLLAESEARRIASQDPRERSVIALGLASGPAS